MCRHRTTSQKLAATDMTPGLLYVKVRPGPGLSADRFHDWYNNEHGPSRLGLAGVFSNGLRYRATDQLRPTFLAVYDVPSTDSLHAPEYERLREGEKVDRIRGEMDIERCSLQLGAEHSAPTFRPLQELNDGEALGMRLLAVELTLGDVAAAEEKATRWCDEYTARLAERPGWLRRRRFRTLGAGQAKLVALLEFETQGQRFSESWRQDYGEYIVDSQRREYELTYIFGRGPRDLASLSRLPDAVHLKRDAWTRCGDEAVICSRVATRDGIELRYRLEGNPAPDAPTVAFCNSLLTCLDMWEPLVSLLTARRPDLRVLRYDTRGRHPLGRRPAPATLSLLADDLHDLLRALRIPRLHALVGVSMGGATAVRFSSRHPQRLARFVACDFKAASSPANTAAWKERVEMARTHDRRPGMHALADSTVQRWFLPGASDGMVMHIRDMVAGNDADGFAYSCRALWDYDLGDDLRGDAEGGKVPGLLVVGEGDGDGAMVESMKSFSHVGQVPLKVVKKAGHLPMCENAEGFWESIEGFL